MAALALLVAMRDGTGRRGRWLAFVWFGLLSTVALLNPSYRFVGPVPVGRSADKDLFRLETLQGDRAVVLDSRWSTMGRTDLVRLPRDTNVLTIFIDGAAGMAMVRFNGDLADTSAPWVRSLRTFGGMIPLLGLACRPGATADAGGSAAVKQILRIRTCMDGPAPDIAGHPAFNLWR